MQCWPQRTYASPTRALVFKDQSIADQIRSCNRAIVSYRRRMEDPRATAAAVRTCVKIIAQIERSKAQLIERARTERNLREIERSRRDAQGIVQQG
jgi:hypothetical protein